MKIFDTKNVDEEAKKKSLRLYKNGTISANPSTPRNGQFTKFNSFGTNNLKNIHKIRKGQCQSARSSFSKSKSMGVHKK